MKNLKNKMLMFLLLFGSFTATAQFDEVDEQEDAANAEVDPAPIDDYVLPMLLLSTAAAGYWLRKEQQGAVEKMEDRK